MEVASTQAFQRYLFLFLFFFPFSSISFFLNLFIFYIEFWHSFVVWHRHFQKMGKNQKVVMHLVILELVKRGPQFKKNYNIIRLLFSIGSICLHIWLYSMVQSWTFFPEKNKYFFPEKTKKIFIFFRKKINIFFRKKRKK